MSAIFDKSERLLKMHSVLVMIQRGASGQEILQFARDMPAGDLAWVMGLDAADMEQYLKQYRQTMHNPSEPEPHPWNPQR